MWIFGSEFPPRFQRCYRKFNPTLLHWATAFFSNGLGKYTIWVYVEKYLNIAVWNRLSPRFQSCYRKFHPTLFHWATEFFQMVLENMQFEFMSKNIWILPFGIDFTPGSRDVIESSIRPFFIGLHRFFPSVLGSF